MLNKIYHSNVNGLPAYRLDIFENWDTLNADTSIYKFKPGKDKRRVFLNDQEKEEFFITKSDGSRVEYSRYKKNIPTVKGPHAGILTMPAFLQRYPSTETNRNRARAR